MVLTIADDGTGFDPARIDRSVAEGHIGLGSLPVRFDATAGAIDIDSKIGHATVVTVTSPPESAAST